MSSDFLPIAQTHVDWELFLASAKKALGRSVTASMDEHCISPVGGDALVAAAAELERKGANPFAALRRGGPCSEHASCTFLVALPRDDLMKLRWLEDLAVTVAEDRDIAMVTANLREWRYAIIEALDDSGTQQGPEARKLLCGILCWFEKNDLGALWMDYEKVSDGPERFFLAKKV